MSPDWVTVTFPRQVEAATPQVTHHETPHVAPHVERLIAVLQGEMSRVEIMDALGFKDRRHFTRAYLQPVLGAGLVEMTQPDRPRSRTQGYRLTALGRQVQGSLPDTGDA